MSAFHVPSVPRGLLLPGLDTHEARNEEQADPTPAGSHWLFRPPPFISWADLRSETITIHNPAAFRGSSLGGYTLSDRQKKHTYTFPPNSVANARRSITLYCCPGKLTQQEFDELPGNVLLWTNQDGSLRRKEVLNDDGESVVLTDPQGKEVAVLDIPGQSGADIMRGAKGVAYMKLPGVKRSQVLALRTLVLTLCYLRLACIAVAASRATVNPDITLLALALAHAFDILCRWASSQPGVPMDDFGVVLATMGDRLASLVVLGSLIVLDTDKRHRQLFGGMLALDITANWLQLSVASAAGGSRPLTGGAFVKGRGAAPDFATHLMLRHPLALTMVSLGNEAFLLWSYLAASASLPRGLRSTALKAGSLLVNGVSYLMGGRSSEHGIVNSDGFGIDEEGEMLGEGEEHGGLASSAGKEAAGFFAGGDWGGGEEFAVAWKVVWMGLMVCCAARQLLSCIQALISMSTLSSGVIADAAGQDLQRRNGRQSSRGRAIDGGGGVSGGGTGSAGSRARSRSRVR